MAPLHSNSRIEESEVESVSSGPYQTVPIDAIQNQAHRFIKSKLIKERQKNLTLDKELRIHRNVRRDVHEKHFLNRKAAALGLAVEIKTQTSDLEMGRKIYKKL